MSSFWFPGCFRFSLKLLIRCPAEIHGFPSFFPDFPQKSMVFPRFFQIFRGNPRVFSPQWASNRNGPGGHVLAAGRRGTLGAAGDVALGARGAGATLCARHAPSKDRRNGEINMVISW